MAWLADGPSLVLRKPGPAPIIMHVKTLLCSLCLLAVGVSTTRADEQPNSPDWTRKVDPPVLQFVAQAASGETDFLVAFTEQADLSGAAKLNTKLAKGTYVFQKLSEVATRTQAPVLRLLESEGIAHQSFWVSNMIRVHGNMSVIQQMAQRDEVARIYANPRVHFQEPTVELDAPAEVNAVEPGISFIRAPQVWALGFTGQGVVVGGNDTGYRWTHNALKGQYRGWNGTVADHNYNWHDSIHSGGGVCGPDSPQPCDDDGHGTHTMGTMVGTDGGSNQIGVAPGAKWMGCRNMNEGVGTPATYSECLQWFIAPTDSGGNNPDPTKAPDVINNSWGCPTSEGCSALTLQTPIENVRAAGIAVIVSAGNDGNACSTVQDPPAIYEASISVGATSNSNNNIAGFSSRGPVTVDGSNRLKPNVTAPGVNIRSSYGLTSDVEYEPLSGTSMAGPHTVGTVALIISAHPEFRGDVDAIQNLLEQTTVHSTTTQTCGGIPGTTIPNNTLGWGRIDALNAFFLGVSPTPTATPVPTPSPTPVATPTPSPTPTAAPTSTPGTSPTVLGNISTRLSVGTGDNALIGGFIITGTQSKKVIVRAIGPSLSVANPLANPTLELRNSSGGLIRSNDDWRIGGQETEIMATTIPPSNDLESAVVETLPANNAAYTAIVRGANDGTGVGLVEAYDLDTSVDSKLANISTRGLVQTEDNVLIAGTIVLGNTSQRVLVRAIGPSLNLPGKLADPFLELRDGNGTLIRSNDNWRSDQETEIMATTIPPTDDLEAALVETLPAGGAAYTATVRGVGGITGIAVVEIYALQ
jgi:subtilisin family serine protease